MITSETSKDLINYAKTLSNEEITELITEFSKIQSDRANDKRRVAAQKVVDAINEYLTLGEEISICGGVYNEDWGGKEEIDATFGSYENHDGYLTFNFVQ